MPGKTYKEGPYRRAVRIFVWPYRAMNPSRSILLPICAYVIALAVCLLLIGPSVWIIVMLTVLVVFAVYSVLRSKHYALRYNRYRADARDHRSRDQYRKLEAEYKPVFRPVDISRPPHPPQQEDS